MSAEFALLKGEDVSLGPFTEQGFLDRGLLNRWTLKEGAPVRSVTLDDGTVAVDLLIRERLGFKRWLVSNASHAVFTNGVRRWTSSTELILGEAGYRVTSPILFCSSEDLRLGSYGAIASARGDQADIWVPPGLPPVNFRFRNAARRREGWRLALVFALIPFLFPFLWIQAIVMALGNTRGGKGQAALWMVFPFSLMAFGLLIFSERPLGTRLFWFLSMASLAAVGIWIHLDIWSPVAVEYRTCAYLRRALKS